MKRTKAPNGNNKKVKLQLVPDKKIGRPSGFKEAFSNMAYKLCLLGATDKDLADFFGVSEDTINVWKKKHPDFFQSLKNGKVKADEMVQFKLFHRAMGYSHPEDKVFLYQGEPVIVPTMKHYPPDTTAGIFWLKNRQPEAWRDVRETSITGKDGGPIEHTVDNKLINAAYDILYGGRDNAGSSNK